MPTQGVPRQLARATPIRRRNRIDGIEPSRTHPNARCRGWMRLGQPSWSRRWARGLGSLQFPVGPRRTAQSSISPVKAPSRMSRDMPVRAAEGCALRGAARPGSSWSCGPGRCSGRAASPDRSRRRSAERGRPVPSVDDRAASSPVEGNLRGCVPSQRAPARHAGVTRASVTTPRGGPTGMHRRPGSDLEQ